MASSKMRGLTKSRKTPEKVPNLESDPAVALWRAALVAHQAYEVNAAEGAGLFEQIPAALRSPSVKFDGVDCHTAPLVEWARDRALARGGMTPETRAKISAEAERAIREITLLRVAVSAAREELGLAAWERSSVRAYNVMNRAELALALYGFKSPAAIVGGLHLAALSDATCDEWPFTLLRIMAEPMLAAVPADLAAAFRSDFPLEISGKLAKAVEAANPGAVG